MIFESIGLQFTFKNISMLGKTIGKIYVMEHTTVFDFVYYPIGTFGLELFTPHQNKIYFNIEKLVINASS